MRRGQHMGLVAVGFVAGVTFVGVTSALLAEPGDLPRWRIGLSVALRFSSLAVAMAAGQLWGLRPYPVWVGLIMVVAYSPVAVAISAWLSERGLEYAIKVWLIALPFHLSAFLLLCLLMRHFADRSRQRPTPSQPPA